MSRHLTLSLLTSVLAAAAALFTPQFVAAKAYSGADRDVPLARFQDPVCPGIMGIERSDAEAMVGLVRQAAADFGLRLADPETCQPNLLVAVIADPRAYLEGLRQRRPYLFDDMDQSERKALFDAPGPAHAWIRVVVSSRDGIPVDQQRNLVDLPHTTMMAAHSLIYVPTRRDITSAMVLIDRKAVQGMTIAQLAAYATMRGLSGDQAQQLETPGQTILNLFDVDEMRPAGLTPSDKIFLKTLYSTMPNIPAAITLSLADARIAEGRE